MLVERSCEKEERRKGRDRKRERERHFGVKSEFATVASSPFLSPSERLGSASLLSEVEQDDVGAHLLSHSYLASQRRPGRCQAAAGCFLRRPFFSFFDCWNALLQPPPPRRLCVRSLCQPPLLQRCLQRAAAGGRSKKQKSVLAAEKGGGKKSVFFLSFSLSREERKKVVKRALTDFPEKKKITRTRRRQRQREHSRISFRRSSSHTFARYFFLRFEEGRRPRV